MTLPERFSMHMKSFSFLQKGQKQLLAVSGGADSVALCELMQLSGYDFAIAHCNFQLRGEESERDEVFVKQLGSKYEKEVLVKRFNTIQFAEERRLSIQVAARELRYAWFNELVNDSSKEKDERFHYILTAHHANDNIETLLMNFFKGTGLAGLHGILPHQNKLVRPLLPFKKEEINDFIKIRELDFVEDSSNSSDKYTRNFLRLKVVPLLKEIYPSLDENLKQNIQRFTQAEVLYNESVKRYKKMLLEIKGNEIHIPVFKLTKIVAYQSLLFEILKEYSFLPSQVKEVESILFSETGKYVQSSTHQAIKNRRWLIIAPISTGLSTHIVIEEGNERIYYEDGSIAIRGQKLTEDTSLVTPKEIAMLDAAEVSFPLLLRKWKQGDYFYPLGMSKKKKLSRFFIDQKLSKTEKEKIWVIESNKKIVWVVNYRIDNRFRITDKTSNILEFTSHKKN